MELPITESQPPADQQSGLAVPPPIEPSEIQPQRAPARIRIGQRILGVIQTLEQTGTEPPELTPKQKIVHDALQQNPELPNEELAGLLGNTSSAANLLKYRLYHRLVHALPEARRKEELEAFGSASAEKKHPKQNKKPSEYAVNTVQSLGRLLIQHGADPLTLLSNSQRELFQIVLDNPHMRLSEISQKQGKFRSSVARSLSDIIGKFKIHISEIEPSVGEEVMDILKSRIVADLAHRLDVDEAVISDFLAGGKNPETDKIFEPLLAVIGVSAQQAFRLRTRYYDEQEE